MSKFNATMHGPIRAEAHTQYGVAYGIIGVVRLRTKDYGDGGGFTEALTIFMPTPQDAENVAAAINAAWPVNLAEAAE